MVPSQSLLVLPILSNGVPVPIVIRINRLMINISFLTVEVLSVTSAGWCFPVATNWLLLPAGHRQLLDCADLACTLVFRVGSIPTSISEGIGGCEASAWFEELAVGNVAV